MTKIAIYPGSFDPITYGHIDLIKRAAKIFKKVVVAVADNSSKDSLFTVKERVALIEQVTADLGNIEVDSFKGLSIDYVRSKGSYVIIRGVRMISDFEYEFQLALMNRKLKREVQTVFLMTSLRWIFTSSSIIKEAAQFGGDITSMVPPLVNRKLKEKFGFAS